MWEPVSIFEGDPPLRARANPFRLRVLTAEKVFGADDGIGLNVTARSIACSSSRRCQPPVAAEQGQRSADNSVTGGISSTRTGAKKRLPTMVGRQGALAMDVDRHDIHSGNRDPPRNVPARTRGSSGSLEAAMIRTSNAVVAVPPTHGEFPSLEDTQQFVL